MIIEHAVSQKCLQAIPEQPLPLTAVKYASNILVDLFEHVLELVNHL